ncbi:MAG TPA: hypothetical protein VF449_01370, partial [Parvibaculum sp.]
LAVLGGANAAALETPEGEFEVIQFRDAALTAPSTYVLSGLLRGQAGTEAAMCAPLAAGARFVLLDGAISEIGMSDAERGLARVWAYGPAPKPLDDVSYVRETRSFKGIGLRPFSPVHVKAARAAGGDIALTWTRRTRTGGDSWEGTDVPLGEESEAYEVDIVSGGVAIRTLSASTPAATYVAASQTADFGSTSFTTLTVRVVQISRAFGRGTIREATLNV